MAEASGYLGKDSEKEKETLGFIRKFTKIKPKESQEFKKKLEALDLMKMNEKYMIKIVDLMPGTQEEINKIFVDVGLSEDETKKILDTVKEFK